MPEHKPSKKPLFQQNHREGGLRHLMTRWKLWFRSRRSGLDYLDFRRAETIASLKSYYLQSKRRKRWQRIGFLGIVLLVLGGIALWLLEERLMSNPAVLRTLSNFVSVSREPDMVPIPAGNFRRGNPGEEGERMVPSAQVVFLKKFALGRFEVTFEEYDRFAIVTNRPLPRDEGWGRGRRPVINVSWEDAASYAKWLSNETGKRFRLPTEAEWEYAAKNAGKGASWAGTSQEDLLEDYAWFNLNSLGRTQSVGQKKPNELGLHDMSGNVSEWVADCWHDNYDEAPSDGSAWLENDGGNCQVRLHRGGAWNKSPEALVSIFRNWFNADSRSTLIGFRLAQDLN